MKIIDISTGVFSSKVFPGDPKPAFKMLNKIENGDLYNLSAVCACTHTGTHVDAPSHYIEDGLSVDKLPLEPFIGECSVVTVNPLVTGEEMEEIIAASKPRILLRGKSHSFLSESAASALENSGVLLIGTDALSISTPESNRRVHIQLFLSQIMLIEGLRLSHVYDGDYMLYAQPILLENLEAAPVRAILVKR